MDTQQGFPRVVDFSVHFSGPIASRHLAQLGADVLKVEAPGRGDGNRWDAPRIGDASALHFYLNAGARSLVFDGRSPEWPDVVAAACRWADVVVVGNTPARAAKLGVDVASVRAHNPEVVYCSITGYGLDGPWHDYPAHGLNTDAFAGAVPYEDDGEHPAAPARYRSFGTTFAGVEAALGIYAGLARQRAGMGGQFVHVSVWEAALAWQWRDTTIDVNLDEPWLQYRDLGPRYAMYRTKDDKVLLVCPIEQRFWEAFCDVAGLPAELRARGDWARGADYGEPYADEAPIIQERMRTRTRAEWERLLGDARIPIAPILDLREASRSEHAAANGAFAEVAYGEERVQVPTAPVSVTALADLGDAERTDLAAAHRRKGEGLRAAPRLGEHTEEALDALGVHTQAAGA